MQVPDFKEAPRIILKVDSIQKFGPMEALIASLLLAGLPALPAETPEQMSSDRADATIENLRPATTTPQKQAACPPGQFPSAFPDVYPTDWAYQAVNRLASRAVECFDLPTEGTPEP